MRFKAMIWDVDGTLVDSEELHRFAFNRAFDEFGLEWHWDIQEYSKLLEITGGKERIRHYVRVSGIDEGSLPVSIEQMHARKTEIYSSKIVSGELPLRGGVAAVLALAKAKKLRLAIATTTSLPNVEALFDSHVLHKEDWEVVVAGDQVERKKPAPDVYLEALSQLGLSPLECIAVEDSANGLASAGAAGIPTVITPNAYTRHQVFVGAVSISSDLEKDMRLCINADSLD